MPDAQLKHLPPNEPILLDNRTCVYCGTELHAEIDTKEHVIAKKFVPKGKLDGQWNLIVRACRSCNERKSTLEDDISAITMQPDTRGAHAVEDEVLVREAGRKGEGSNSRWTGRPVKHSYEKFNIEVALAPSVKLTFNLTGLPTIDDARIFELALMQVRAFFYFITYDKTSREGHFWLGAAYPVMCTPRSDWGNVAHRAFMDAVRHWDHRVHGIVAGEFFKISIRKHPAATCWSWAVEWNQNYRVIGFFGERKPAEQIVATFPRLDWAPVTYGSSGAFTTRMDKTLAAEDDSMFELVPPPRRIFPSRH